MPGVPGAPRPPRGPGRAAWVVALLGAAVLLAATGAVALRTLGGADPDGTVPAAAAAAAGDPRATGVNAALALMARGLRAHDEATFLSAVGPRDAALRTRQRAFYRGLAALPLKDVQVSWDGERLRAPARPAGYPAGTVVVIAELRYLIDGWDDEPVDDALVLTMAPSGSHWLVVGDGEAAGDSNRRYLEPWSTGSALVVERRPHVLAVGDAAHRSDVRRLADRLEDVTADVRARWSEPSWNGRVVAYAATDPRFVQAWFDAQAATGPPRDRPAAQPTWEARVGNLARSAAEADAATGPPRLVVTPYVLGRSDARVVSTLRHEVTHVATARVGRPVPGWLAEGAAEYTGFRLGGSRVDALRTFTQHGLTGQAAEQLRRGTWTPQLRTDRESFYRGSADEVAAGYLDGWLASLYIADRYGDAVLSRFYDVASAQPAEASSDVVEVAALRAVLGTDHAGFVAAVRVYGTSLYRRATGTS